MGCMSIDVGTTRGGRKGHPAGWPSRAKHPHVMLVLLCSNDVSVVSYDMYTKNSNIVSIHVTNSCRYYILPLPVHDLYSLA